MDKKYLAIFIFTLVLVNIAVFGKTKGYEFISYDDPEYIIDNQDIRGINGRNLKAIFTSYYVGNYQPLTVLTYAAENALFGNTAGGYHITSDILHILNSILVLLLVFSITKRRWLSFIVALLFSLHPMQVESVAWLSERKGLLCGFFYFLSFLAYIGYKRREAKGLYISSFVLFLCALLSKPMAITLPIALLLFDYHEDKITRKSLVEKIPYFVLTAVFVVVVFVSQKSANSITVYKSPLSPETILLAFYNIGFYVYKLLLPLDLSAHYGYADTFSYASKEFIVSIIVILALAAYLKYIKRISKGVNFGLLLFLVSLVPILRFVPIGDTYAADRYVYIPMIGFFLAIALLIDGLISDREKLKKALQVLVVLLILFYGSLTYARLDVWRNSFVFWSDVIEDSPDYKNALFGLGTYYLFENPAPKKSREYFTPLLKHPRWREKVLYSVGVSYVYDNDFRASREHFTALVNEFPGDKDRRFSHVYRSLGDGYAIDKEYDRAFELYEKSLRLHPGDPVTHYNYAMQLKLSGNIPAAVKHFKAASRINPGWALPQKELSKLAAPK